MSDGLDNAALLALVAVVPLVVLMLTSFVKISVVLALLRNAIGAPDAPSGIVVLGLSLVLTFFVMAPVGIDMVRAAAAQGGASPSPTPPPPRSPGMRGTPAPSGASNPDATAPGTSGGAGSVRASPADVSAGTSGNVSAGTPAAGTSGGVSAGTSGGVSAGTSGGVSAGTPGNVSAGTPGGVSTGTPGNAAAGTPAAGTPGNVAAGTSGGVPAGTSGEGSAGSPGATTVGAAGTGADAPADVPRVRLDVDGAVRQLVPAKYHPQVAAAARALGPLEAFLARHTDARDRDTFVGLAHRMGREANGDELWVLAPAFLATELREAFAIAVLLFLPFLVLDLVVGLGLAALGLATTQPQTIALPLKLLLFVAVDGWRLLIDSLLRGYV